MTFEEEVERLLEIRRRKKVGNPPPLREDVIPHEYRREHWGEMRALRPYEDASLRSYLAGFLNTYGNIADAALQKIQGIGESPHLTLESGVTDEPYQPVRSVADFFRADLEEALRHSRGRHLRARHHDPDGYLDPRGVRRTTLWFGGKGWQRRREGWTGSH